MAVSKKDAASFIPATHTLAVLRGALQECRGCELYDLAQYRLKSEPWFVGEGKHQQMAAFVDDLRSAKRLLDAQGHGGRRAA